LDEAAMVFEKQIGRLFNRKKTVDNSQDVGAENSAGENQLSSNLDNPVIVTGISGAAVQAPVKDLAVIETYALNEPYAYVNVTRDVVKGNITYAVEEPALSEVDFASLQRLKGILNEVLQLKPIDLCR
jgi:hypothetical protein